MTETGIVEAIHITAGAGQPMRRLDRAEALAGAGLAGDRYANGVGYYSAKVTPDGGREVTLFEVETLDYLAHEHGITFSIDEHRRNVTTRGIRLLDLIGRRFRIGDVLCYGVRECTPCIYIQQLSGKPVLEPLVHRGGLRANILQGGAMRVGDTVVAVDGD